MRSDCQHPDCSQDGLKNNARYCEGHCSEWAKNKTNKGLKEAKTIPEAVSVLTDYGQKW